MKIDYKNNNIVVFIKKDNTDFKDYDKLEDYFINLFTKLKKITNKDMSGLYLLNVYIDKYYGSVVEIIEEDDPYTYYLDDQIDMKVNIINIDFLYEIDYYDINKDIFDIYKCKNKIYIKPKKQISNKEFINLIENSRIIYDTKNIFLTSKKV